MTDQSKPKIENLDQQAAHELTPEQAEVAQGGIIINGTQATSDRSLIIDWRSPSLGGPDT